MDGWLVEMVDRRMVGWIDGWTDGRMVELIDRRMNG